MLICRLRLVAYHLLPGVIAILAVSAAAMDEIADVWYMGWMMRVNDGVEVPRGTRSKCIIMTCMLKILIL